ELAGLGPEDHLGMPAQTLTEALARLIQPLANQQVSASDFEWERVPGHLRMNFRVVDERGRVIGSDRELSTLQQELAGRAREKVAEVLRPSSRGFDPVPDRPSSRAGFAGARSGTA